MKRSTRSSERGIALIVVMLMTVAVATVAAAAIFLTSGATLISKGHEREEELRNAADAGIELGRSALNGNPSLFPESSYAVLTLNQPVYDANNQLIPGVTRSIYYGPTGSSTGQYGIFGSVVSVIQDQSGAVVVRRGELAQESFAKFAYYTDDEGSGICFGGGDNIFGPVHTNDDMCIYSSGVHFHDNVEVAGTISGKNYGQFDQGYLERGAVIPLPTTADLNKLNTYATQGGMSYTSPTGGRSAQARMRIEFMSLDLDGDGRVTGPDEGFYRIYEDTGSFNSDHINYVMANRRARTDFTDSRNCGHYHSITQGGVTRQVFVTAYDDRYPNNASLLPGHTGGGSNRSTTAATAALTSGTYRCFLGGDDRLFVDSSGAGSIRRNTFTPADFAGRWIRYTATPNPAVVAALANPASGIADTTLANRSLHAQYLFPLSRAMNPNSKGVIYVTGKVALSGVLNSRLTVAASDNVIIADDLRYAITPGSAPCQGSNMLGLLSPDSIFLADNAINAAWDLDSNQSAHGFRNYDDTNDEFIQGVILTLRSYTVEQYNLGSNSNQDCGTTNWGRGCMYLTGGIIQDQRGAVGTSGGTGYLKRYAYDVCAFQTPPPYFPTTGRFLRNRYYEIDPIGFDIAGFFASLAPNP